jgi:Replication protein
MLSEAKIGLAKGPSKQDHRRPSEGRTGPELVGAIIGRSLDKLAQLRQAPSNASKNAPKAPDGGHQDDRKKLLKRAKAKYITNGISNRLRNLDSPLHKSYINTFFCAQTLRQAGQKLTGRYCGNRWCLVCNRIRTGRLISAYQDPLVSLPDKYFVTLTRPNVKGDELRDEIKTLIAHLRVILNDDLRRKHKVKLKGIRKLECTYNTKRNDYHPHFHFIVSGKREAELLVSSWLNRCPTASPLAQDIRKCDDGSVMELFKYFTKVVQDGRLYPYALDISFRAMRKLRVYQPFGIRKVSEEVEDIISEQYDHLMDDEIIWVWRDDHQSGDWYSRHTGEALTEYKPNEWAMQFRNGGND